VPPVPPSNIKVEAESDTGTKLTVTWDALTPEEAWGFVTYYTVSYKKPTDFDTGMEMSVSSTKNSLQIEGLDPNQDYVIVMWANTTTGMGQQSKPISTKSE
jgi:fibronectin type 3 domain-containing protein